MNGKTTETVMYRETRKNKIGSQRKKNPYNSSTKS